MQDHVHDRDDVSERLLLLAEESAPLKRLYILRRQARLCSKVLERFAEEPGRADHAVVNALADTRLHDLDDGADERTRRVILAAVSPGVAHVPDLGFVEMGELVLLTLGAEAQLVDVVDDLAQVVAALDLILDLTEYLANLVFDRVRSARLLLETMQVGKELPVYEIPKVVAGQGPVVIEFAVLALGRGPSSPIDRAHPACSCISCPPAPPRCSCLAQDRRGISGTAARRSARCNRAQWCSRLLSEEHHQYF